MAINNIPGVGPANSDVATAVAAVVPNASQITAAVPTTAQIATAVAAPSAATIAAAVAAPTLAQINNSVATNAPSPNNWTLIGTSGQGAGTYTFSGISGYKTLRWLAPRITRDDANGLTQCFIRFNGDTSPVYTPYRSFNVVGGAVVPSTVMSSTYFDWQVYMNAGNAGVVAFDFLIENVLSTTLPKVITGSITAKSSGDGQGASIGDSFKGMYYGSGALTSITFSISPGLTAGQPIYLLGQN